MTPVKLSHEINFLAAGPLAPWVRVWGYSIPAHVDEALPWLVPPLHARFLGAMYRSGTTFTVGCLLARRWAEMQVVLPMIAIWTGTLSVVSLLHLGEFSLRMPPSDVWFAAYSFYPLIATWLAWRHRGALSPEAALPRVTAVAHIHLLAQGMATAALALTLLFAPGWMTPAWPWKITPLLAQPYSAPFLSYGLGSLLLARRTTWLEVRIVLTAIWVIAGGVVVASLIHHELFSITNLATCLWFAGFAGATPALAILSAMAWLDLPRRGALGKIQKQLAAS